jgi:hypothetical protein
MPAFRSDDQVTIRPAVGSPDRAPVFDHDDGRPRIGDERLEVVLDIDDWVAYDIDVGSASRIQVRLEAEWPGGSAEATPAVRLGDEPLAQTNVDRCVVAESQAELRAGPIRLRVQSRATETVIRSIDVAVSSLLAAQPDPSR